MEPVSLKDIADKTGFHRSTVSRALKNDRRLPQATIQKIQQVAEEMGYKVNPLVSSMMAKRASRVRSASAGTIAMIVPAQESEWGTLHYSTQSFFKGVSDRIKERSFSVEVMVQGTDASSFSRLSDILYNRGIQGVCFCPLDKRRRVENFKWERFAAASVGYSLSKPALHRASHHSSLGMTLLLKTLRDRGYRRIGFCISKGVYKRGTEIWLSAFLGFQYDHPDMKLSFVLTGASDDPYDQIETWIYSEDLDVVINDSANFYYGLIHKGFKVPENLGFASLAWNAHDPHISGINQLFEGVGAAAVDLVVAQLQRNERGVPAHPRHVMIEGEWVEGKTAPGK